MQTTAGETLFVHPIHYLALFDAGRITCVPRGAAGRVYPTLDGDRVVVASSYEPRSREDPSPDPSPETLDALRRVQPELLGCAPSS